MKNRNEPTGKSASNTLNRGDWHVSNSSMGMGDYYGQGVRNPVGRIRDSMGQREIPEKELRVPPKALA
jgi:hypothetical protein